MLELGSKGRREIAHSKAHRDGKGILLIVFDVRRTQGLLEIPDHLGIEAIQAGRKMRQQGALSQMLHHVEIVEGRGFGTHDQVLCLCGVHLFDDPLLQLLRSRQVVGERSHLPYLLPLVIQGTDHVVLVGDINPDKQRGGHPYLLGELGFLRGGPASGTALRHKHGYVRDGARCV